METNKHKLSGFLSISQEVQDALMHHQPILALESTVLTHGLPYPQNIDVAYQLEAIARETNVTPATVAIINGKIKIGLSHDDIQMLAEKKAHKASVRDLGLMISQKASAGTTVALTAMLSTLAGIRVFSTGGIGGVHFGDEMDVSADLVEMSRQPIAIISAGPKAILDIGRTLEVLESYSVPIVGFNTHYVPAFYSRTSAYSLPHSFDTINALTQYVYVHHTLSLSSAVLIMNPIPAIDEIPEQIIQPVIHHALQKAKEHGIKGKALTPFLLAELNKLTDGQSVQANLALLKNNVTVGAALSKQLILHAQSIG